LYFFRDQQGLEVDFVVPTGSKGLLLVEAKASRTVRPEMAKPLIRLAGAVGNCTVSSCVVHRSRRVRKQQGGPSKSDNITALKEGVKAVTIDGLLDFLRL
jgi:hypothetical protein